MTDPERAVKIYTLRPERALQALQVFRNAILYGADALIRAAGANKQQVLGELRAALADIERGWDGLGTDDIKRRLPIWDIRSKC